MLDLSQRAIQAWIQALDPSHAPSDWPPAFRAIEADGHAHGLFKALGAMLDRVADRPGGLSTALRTPPLAEHVRAVLAQVGSARVFRFLHWLDERDLPDSHLIVAGLIEGDRPDARALRATISAFVHRQLLGRILAEDRIAALHAASAAALTKPA